MKDLKVVSVYELVPINGRKSFYGKAKVKVLGDGSEILQSYDTDIIERTSNGRLYLLCDESKLSMTTCTHIKSFCGLNKKMALDLQRKQPYERLNNFKTKVL